MIVDLAGVNGGSMTLLPQHFVSLRDPDDVRLRAYRELLETPSVAASLPPACAAATHLESGGSAVAGTLCIAMRKAFS